MPKSKFTRFDTTALQLRPLRERKSDYSRETLYLPPLDGVDFKWFPAPLIQSLRDAKARRRPIVAFLGGHVIKQGCSRLLLELIANGWITHLAGNGAVMVHDWELSLLGKTSESVERYITDGQFGMWAETGNINHAVQKYSMKYDAGLGEAVGRCIKSENDYHADSLLAGCVQANVPCTIHPGIGYDIHHMHDSFSPGVFGSAAHIDFLVFAHTISQLEGGVFLNLGSAVAGPEVYLKALSMARNVATQCGETISKFTTAVFDVYPLGSRRKAPTKKDPAYYFRPLKTILDRTTKDGGQSFYVQGDHSETIPRLHRVLTALDRL